MKRLLKVLKQWALYSVIILFGWLLIVIFMPKSSLWYQMESVLAEEKIIMHAENLHEGLFDLKVLDGQLYYGTMNIARIESLDIIFLGFYNKVMIENLFVGSELPLLEGLHLKSAEISYIVFAKISIEALGNFGSLRGSIDLDKHLLVLNVEPSAWLQKHTPIMSRLDKQDKGYRFAWNY